MDEHKDKYKHQVDSVDKLKEKRGQEVISLRKEKREKIVSSKRFRFEDGQAGGGEHGFTEEMVTDSCKKLQHSGQEKLPLLQCVRQACAQGVIYIDAFFKVENSLQCIVGLLTGNDVELQHEAAWCLTNISAGNTDHALSVAKSAAPYLITYLSSNNPLMQDQCAWALGNLAGDSPECRTMMQAQGAVVPLVTLLQSPVPAVVQSAAFALSNIARDSPDVTRELVTAGLVPMLVPYISLAPENRPILEEVAWILTYLSTSGEHVPLMIENGLLTSAVSLIVKLQGENPQDVKTVTPLLRCLGNICSGPNDYTLLALENPRLLHTVGQYLDSSIRHIVKETLWVLSNIVGEPSVAASVSSGPILQKVTDKLEDGFDIKQEALYVLNNLLSHGPEACESLLNHKVLPAVVPILKSHDVDVLNLALAFIEMMLRFNTDCSEVFESYGGVTRLEGLEYHSNHTIAEKANSLLEMYFQKENEDVGQ
ncbi:uncharacterized protein LOC127861681 [Dreissena polymorpha]|uniref:Importin subunit alpha n=1 Tax=Dreissena polymorpha TaxID=45954 RepID=A0A9D4NGR0_DREPO|nr:uncharacterized protein LOC127861681 [Dreissena polymorpha]KAH3894055.1 hypothetical protein DPMN_018212 [Dreissena polymorpha]